MEKVSWNDASLDPSNAAEQTAGPTRKWNMFTHRVAMGRPAGRDDHGVFVGNTIVNSNANYNWDGAYNTGNDFKQTRDVGQYVANPWGFFDMHGNVWEWTADRYQVAYPTGNLVINPTGPISGSTRVIRGGSWHGDEAYLRSAERHGWTPNHRHSNLGFRVSFQKASKGRVNSEE